MSDIDVQKEIEDLKESLTDVIDSMIAVKGEQFTDTVMTAFELEQIVKVTAIMSMEKDDDARRSMVALCFPIFASLIGRVSRGMSKDEYEEAIAMAKQLGERRTQLEKTLTEKFKG